MVTALNVVLKLASAPAAVGVRELEGPEEIACLLEIGASGMDFVDEIFDGDDAVLSERSLNDGVVGEGVHAAYRPFRSRACRSAHERTLGWARYKGVDEKRSFPFELICTHPYVTYGSTRRNICWVAFVTLTKRHC